MTRLRLIAAFTILGGAALSMPATGQAALHCPTGTFTANIHKGPDADLSLAGRLIGIRVSDGGKVTGTLTHYGKSVAVLGHVRGRKLTLRFTLRSGLRIHGSGLARRPIRTCADMAMTGRERGPRRGDRGDWGIIWGS
jgi:hypothetical protein